MAYVPKDWVTGEVITEQALDHIEQGIAGLIMVVTETVEGTTYSLNKTWNEINNAMANGTLVVRFKESEGWYGYVLLSTAHYDGSYAVDAEGLVYTATSADGYPSYVAAGEDDG